MDTHNARMANVIARRPSDTDWQRIWLSARTRDWSSLAIIASDTGMDVQRVADMLVATGTVHGEKSVSLLNARGADLADVARLMDTLEGMTARGDLVVIPMDPISENPTSIPLLQAASATVLVIRLGESLLGSARHIIDIAGRERIL